MHALKSYLGLRFRDRRASRFPMIPEANLNRPTWRYRLYGFELESALEFPELPPSEPDGRAADVVLRFGRTPERLENPRVQGVCYQTAPGEMLCWLPGAGRFHVEGGTTITVEAAIKAAPEALRNLVLSSPLAALLLQRQLLPVHASAVATPCGVALFASGAGLGKSTLAAELGRRGFDVLSDDITAFHISDRDGVRVLPGDCGVRLWPDSVAVVEGGAPETVVRPEWVKRWMTFGNRQPGEPAPVAAIYVLDRGEAPPGAGPLVRFAGATVMATVLDLVYRPAFARGLGLERQVFSQAAAVVKSTRVMQLIAPANRLAPGELAQRVLEDLGL